MCSKTEAKAALTKAFQSVDKDKSGTIDAKELEGVLTTYYTSAKKPVDNAKIKGEAQKFITEVDKSKDGKVSLEEFLKYFEQCC